MPFSDNIVTDYGAVADGDYRYGTFTVAASGTHLTFPTAIWVPGDVGKTIVVSAAVSHSSLGGLHLLTTIDAVDGDGKGVTLHDAATEALPGPRYDVSDTVVAWGTNNASAFETFTSTRQVDTGTLTIPAGVYFVASVSGGNIVMFDGITNLTVAGTGATLCGGRFGLSASVQYQDPDPTTHSSHIQTVAAGSSTIVPIDPADLSKFTVGQYVLVTGICLMASGFPSNQQFLDYVLVASKDATSVTFATPLTDSYKSTWPTYYSGGFLAPDYGGPALAYILYPNYDFTLSVTGLTVAQQYQWALSGRIITMTSCIFDGPLGPYPTSASSVSLIDCTGLACTMEVDKMVESFMMTGCTWFDLNIASASIKSIVLDSSSFHTIVGSSRRLVLQNGCSVSGVLVPDLSFGYASELRVSDSTVASFGGVAHSSGYVIGGGTGAANGVNVDFTMTNGVIRVSSSFYNDGYLPQWVVEGGRVFFYDSGGIGTLGMFTIIDVTQDASYTYIHTNAGGTWPSRSFAVGVLYLRTHPAPACTFANVTGCPEVVDLCNTRAVGRPLYSYSKRLYTDFSGGFVDSDYWTLWGKIVEVNISVDQEFTGTGSLTGMASFENHTVNAATYADLAFNPVVNLKAPGMRSWTPETGWTGSIDAGDTLPTLGAGVDVWSGGNFRTRISTPISGQSSGTWPTFSIEVITDQDTQEVPPILLGQACM